METTDRLDRWIPRLMVVTILAVAAFAFVQSYTHGFYWGETHHQNGASLRMFPLIADWIMFAAGLTMLHLGRKGISHPLPRAALVLGATVTLAINIAAGIIWGWETALTNSWAPVALFVVVELGMLLVRTAKAKPAQPELSLSQRDFMEGRKTINEMRAERGWPEPPTATELRTPQATQDPGPETVAIPVVPEVTGSPEPSLSGWGQLGRPQEPAGQASQLGRQEPSGGLTGIGLSNGRK